MRSVFSALILFLFLALLTGVVYPLAVMGIAQLVFPYQAHGGLVKDGDRIIGSIHIGQVFEDNKYFWSRPSAHDYDALNSGGTNFAPTSAELKKLSTERRERLAMAHQSDLKSVPGVLIYASGSGLDPHITAAAAYFQVDRIAQARNIHSEQGVKDIKELIRKNLEERTFRYFGNPHVNVLLLNQALDKYIPKLSNG